MIFSFVSLHMFQSSDSLVHMFDIFISVIQLFSVFLRLIIIIIFIFILSFLSYLVEVKSLTEMEQNEMKSNAMVHRYANRNKAKNHNSIFVVDCIVQQLNSFITVTSILPIHKLSFRHAVVKDSVLQ